MGGGGWSVPSIVEPHVIRFIKNKAKFILLIEKGAVWARFNEDRFWEKYKCMIVHGSGQPLRGVRRLCCRMVNELNLPFYVLVDNDPWGYYIYSVIKQGSINLAFESMRMAIPTARFLGISSSAAAEFDISPSVTLRLNDKDISRAKERTTRDLSSVRAAASRLVLPLADTIAPGAGVRPSGNVCLATRRKVVHYGTAMTIYDITPPMTESLEVWSWDTLLSR